MDATLTPEATTRFRSVDWLASRYSISSATVYAWVRAGYLPAPVKIGTSSRWDELEVIAAEARFPRGVDRMRNPVHRARASDQAA